VSPIHSPDQGPLAHLAVVISHCKVPSLLPQLHQGSWKGWESTMNCKTSMAGRHNERLADKRRVVPTNNVKHWFVSPYQKSPQLWKQALEVL